MPTSSSWSILRSCLLAGLACSAVVATADDALPTGTTFRVLDARYESSSGDPLVLDDDRAVLFDHPNGLPRAVPTSSILGISVGPVAMRDRSLSLRTAIRRAGDDLPIGTAYLELVDGQRIPGGLGADSEGRPVWQSPWIQDLPFDLERIRVVRLDPEARVEMAEDEDVVVLANGDELRGLVERIGAYVEIEVEGPNGPRSVKVLLSRVGSISLVNPVESVSGAMSWFRGGHRLASRTVRIDDDGYVRLVEPALGGDVAEVPLEHLIAIALRAERLSPLSAAPVRVDRGEAPGRRPWIPPPSLAPGHHAFDAAPIRLDGPLEATFEMPTSPVDVIGTLERPADSGVGRLVVVVRDGDQEVGRHVLDADRSVADLAVRIDSGRLVIEIEEGGDGPFRDTVTIREALVVRTGP